MFFSKNHVEKGLRYQYHFHIKRINPVKHSTFDISIVSYDQGSNGETKCINAFDTSFHFKSSRPECDETFDRKISTDHVQHRKNKIKSELL